MKERNGERKRVKRESHNRSSRHADGDSRGGGGGRGGCRRLEDLAGKDAGAFVLADDEINDD